MPTKNPFRAHIAQSAAIATGSQTSQRPESPPLPPLPSGESSPPIPSSPTHPTPSESASASLGNDIRLDDDLPPAYTPSADTSMGEETLEVGPRRPFQPPRPNPTSSPYAPSQSGSQSLFPLPSGQSVQPWSTGPGSHPQNLTRWQSQHQYQRHGRSGGLIGALLRDVVDVMAGTHDQRMIEQRANAVAYTAPYATAGAYAPPSVPPPHAQRIPPPPPRPRSTPPRSPPAVPDDGTPTQMPVPGHPLLRDGNLLVYPKDHLCVKCKNTGYKNYDPSHPCNKCWDKYGKPYTGAITYTPWARSGNDPRMQRALPRFVPPHLAPVNTGPRSEYHSRRTEFLPPPQHPHHSRSSSHPHVPPTGLSYYVVNPLISWDSTPPVPHAIPVSPGDPRLGGWICTRCGGEGVRPMLLFDLTPCETCGGTGRVWR